MHISRYLLFFKYFGSILFGISFFLPILLLIRLVILLSGNFVFRTAESNTVHDTAAARALAYFQSSHVPAESLVMSFSG